MVAAHRNAFCCEPPAWRFSVPSAARLPAAAGDALRKGQRCSLPQEHPKLGFSWGREHGASPLDMGGPSHVRGDPPLFCIGNRHALHGGVSDVKKDQSPHIIIWRVDFVSLATSPTVCRAGGQGNLCGAVARWSVLPPHHRKDPNGPITSLLAVLDCRDGGPHCHPGGQGPPGFHRPPDHDLDGSRRQDRPACHRPPGFP